MFAAAEMLWLDLALAKRGGIREDEGEECEEVATAMVADAAVIWCAAWDDGEGGKCIQVTEAYSGCSVHALYGGGVGRWVGGPLNPRPSLGSV